MILSVSNNLSDGFKINVDKVLIEYLADKEYSINDLFIIYCIENNRKDLLESYISKKNSDQRIAFFQRFERKLLLYHLEDADKFDINNYLLTSSGERLLSDTIHYFNGLDLIESVPSDNLDIFVRKFRDLWPDKIKNKAGEIIKSHEVDLKSKLKIFFKKYKYNEEIILKATKNYISRQSIVGYEYCNAAHYFISKNQVSKLASECENVVSGNEEDISSFSNMLM